MESSKQVLLLTKEPAIQNLVEQVCRIDGYRVITAATIEDVLALTTQGGRNVFVLAVIDPAAFEAPNPEQADRARQQWRAWADANVGLPLIVLDARTSSSVFLTACANPSVFLEKPFGPHVFADMMRTLITGSLSTTTPCSHSDDARRR